MAGNHQEAAASPSPAKGGRVWLTSGVLASISAAAYLDRTIMAFLVEPIKTDLALSDVQVSLLIGGAFSALYLFANIAAGAIVDKVDRRNLILGTGLLWSAASIACGLASTYWQLLVARMVLGAAEAFIGPASYALMRDRIPVNRHGQGFSILGMAPYVGGAGAYILGGVLLRKAMAGEYAGLPLIGGLAAWQIVIIAVGVFSMFPVLLMLFLKKDGKRVQQPGQEASFGAALRYLRKHSKAYAILASYSCFGTMIALGANSWIATVMHRTYHIPLPEVGATVGPLGLVFGILGLIACGQILDRIEKKGGNLSLFALVASIATGAGMGVIAQLPQSWQAWAAYCVANVFAGAAFPISASLMSRITPSHLMGKVTALFLLLMNISSGVIGITLVAFLAEHLFTGERALGNGLTLFSLTLGAASAVAALFLNRTAAVGKAA